MYGEDTITCACEFPDSIEKMANVLGGRPELKVNNNELQAIVKADPLQTREELATYPQYRFNSAKSITIETCTVV